jgi:hypothetical protein
VISAVFAACICAGCSRQPLSDAPREHTMRNSPNSGEGLRGVTSGYSGSSDWRGFLRCWFAKVQSAPASDRLNASTKMSFLQSNAPAIDGLDALGPEGILLLEHRLGYPLPRSFVDFQSATHGNSWYGYIDGFDLDIHGLRAGLYPAKQVGKFREIDSAGWSLWADAAMPKPHASEYYRYGHNSGQIPSGFESSRIGDFIKVGGLAQGAVILLNPFERTSDGEMEAWLLSPAHGVVRYLSFAALVKEMAYRDLKGGGGFLVPSYAIEQHDCLRLIIAEATYPHASATR